MKKLFCVSVTDPGENVGLGSPIIFHIKCETSDQAEEAVRDMLEKEYDYEQQYIDEFEIFVFEVTEVNIVEI